MTGLKITQRREDPMNFSLSFKDDTIKDGAMPLEPLEDRKHCFVRLLG